MNKSKSKSTTHPTERGDTSWLPRAACRDIYVSPEWFFTRRSIGTAKAVCARCPVVTECRLDALVNEAGLRADRRFGVRGGLTSDERYRMAGLPLLVQLVVAS